MQLGLGLPATLAAGRARAAATVRYASTGGATDAGIYLADEYGFFREAGLEVSVVRLESASTLLAAVATGQIDVAGISVTPGLFASQRQGMTCASSATAKASARISPPPNWSPTHRWRTGLSPRCCAG